jgi:hypothetical protein
LFSICPPDAPENVFTQEVKVSERWVPAFPVPFEVQLVTPTWPFFGVFEPFRKGKVGTRLAKVEKAISSLNTLPIARQILFLFRNY